MVDSFELSRLRDEAESTVNGYALGCAATALVTAPIPGTSVLLTGIEAKMTFSIAKIYGYHPTLQEAAATVSGLVAASGALKYLAVETATFFPVIGWFAKPSIAMAACKTVGQLVINHYEQKRRGES